MSLGTRLRQLREAVPKLSTRELDRLAGRPEGHCWSIEKGDGKDVYAETAVAFASVLGCSLVYLIQGIGEPPTPEQIGAAVEAARGDKAPPVVDLPAPTAPLPRDPAGAAAVLERDEAAHLDLADAASEDGRASVEELHLGVAAATGETARDLRRLTGPDAHTSGTRAAVRG